MRELDSRNMVVDFSDIKRVVKGWIDRELDHKMILRHDDPLVKPLKELGEPMYLLESNPTVERIARLIFEKGRELGIDIDAATIQRLRARHAEQFLALSGEVLPLPGAAELLQALSELQLPWAIATSGRMETASANLLSLGVDKDSAIVVTRDQVNYAKPDPDLFVEAARRLGTTTQGSYVIGDSIWDMIAAARCGALGIGLLSGGYGRDELERAGALRVYDDPEDMLLHLDEIAPRTRD